MRVTRVLLFCVARVRRLLLQKYAQEKYTFCDEIVLYDELGQNKQNSWLQQVVTYKKCFPVQE